MFFPFLIFIIYFTINSCQAQIPIAGPCMNIERPANYDPTKVLGRWYRYASYPSCDVGGRCRQSLLIGNNDGSMTIIEKRLSTLPGEPPIRNRVSIVQYLGDASYRMTSPKDDSLFNQTLIFWNTDYTSYAIKGACVNINQASMYYVWIMVREPHPSANVIAQINKAIESDGFQMEFIRRGNQTNCPADY